MFFFFFFFQAEDGIRDRSPSRGLGGLEVVVKAVLDSGADGVLHAREQAQAILRLFPGMKYAIGPTIENGFYYDFQFSEPITDADLGRIEKEMARIVSQNLPVTRAELPRAEALAVFGPAGAAGPAGPGADQPFKVELIEDLPGEETISVYTQGDFIDLCRGPHLPSTSRLGNGTFKLTSLA